jgi:hypothetical protein
MNVTQEQANRLVELREEIQERLGEFKQICRETMHKSEYDQFKYRTLGHIEPVVSEETEWVTRYSSTDSLESVAANALNDVVEEDDASTAEEENAV